MQLTGGDAIQQLDETASSQLSCEHVDGYIDEKREKVRVWEFERERESDWKESQENGLEPKKAVCLLK
jgi:hypothetical protein